MRGPSGHQVKKTKHWMFGVEILKKNNCPVFIAVSQSVRQSNLYLTRQGTESELLFPDGQGGGTSTLGEGDIKLIQTRNIVKMS